MCHTCKDCNAEPRNCKTELRRRLVRALEIVDAMEGDVFELHEREQAVELNDLLEDIRRDHVPPIHAWCAVKVYAKVHGESEAPSISANINDSVWYGYESKPVATREAAKLQAHFKQEHEAHPWWGPWETCGDKFVVRKTNCSIDELKRGLERCQPS